MESEIIMQNDKKYFYVISYYESYYSHLKNTDISIFEINEWHDLLNISKVFEESIDNIKDLYDEEYIIINRDLKQAIYYLYYNCHFCKHNGFNYLEYYHGNKNDINERVFIEVQNENRDHITINYFRKWIIANYDKIRENYDIIKSFFYK